MCVSVCAGLSEASSYRVLEHIASTSEPEAPTFYPCPICRKPQILDIDTLQVMLLCLISLV